MKFSILIISLIIVLSSCFLSDPSFAQNHVLSLDSLGDYVQLPSNIFNQLTEATVEGWVKWEKLFPAARFFNFGEQTKAMGVICGVNPADLTVILIMRRGFAMKANINIWSLRRLT